MELTKEDTQKAKGVAILGMVMLHLFCHLGDLLYTPWIWVGETPLIYYLGLFGDLCVPIYCFCSGYAHYPQKERYGPGYSKTIHDKLLRFLTNYWIVVLLFSTIGLLSGNGETIPGSVQELLGNLFLYGLSYNGAWWFVATYVFLSVLSPFFIQLTNKLHPFLTVTLSGAVYFISYLFRFNHPIMLPNAPLNWIWQHMILLGTSQFGYLIGMVCRRMRLFAKLRALLSAESSMIPVTAAKLGIILLPIVAFVGHCIVQSAIVAPFTAAATLVCLFTLSQPAWLHHTLLFLGKHSTNIWLVHMFFYCILFQGLVFEARYPVLILVFMFTLCICISCVIRWIDQMICGISKTKNKE